MKVALLIAATTEAIIWEAATKSPTLKPNDIVQPFRVEEVDLLCCGLSPTRLERAYPGMMLRSLLSPFCHADTIDARDLGWNSGNLLAFVGYFANRRGIPRRDEVVTTCDDDDNRLAGIYATSAARYWGTLPPIPQSIITFTIIPTTPFPFPLPTTDLDILSTLDLN
jgi:hypothetical protein